MYELTVDAHFDAAHCLDGYNGECANVHGHTWLVSATVRTEELDDIGMSVDFKIVRQSLEWAVGIFDHTVLNNLDLFANSNPTAENLSRIIFERLSERLKSYRADVVAITVGEGSRNRLTYRP